MAVRGFVERVSMGSISGWVIDEERPGRKLVVELLIDNHHIASADAQIERPDLSSPGCARAFVMRLPFGVPLNQANMKVRIVGSDTTLPLIEGACGFEGYIDFISGKRIGGWAWKVAAPGQPVKLVVRKAGVDLRQVTANTFRADLLEAGIGDGQHAFLIDLASVGGTSSLLAQEIEVVFAETQQPLINISSVVARRSVSGEGFRHDAVGGAVPAHVGDRVEPVGELPV